MVSRIRTGGECPHRTKATVEEAWRSLGDSPGRCGSARGLDREPKESILAHFDVTVIRRYFPEFEREIGRYLALAGLRGGRNTR